jgi:catechol 2,3-dioxygenase-like lactoylglutathione lyase family enzyme
VLAFHHLAVQCQDLEACERFYRDVLGLRVLRRWPLPGQAKDRSVWLAVGGNEDAGFLALERVEDRPEPRPWRDGRPGLHLIALQIPAAERRSWEARLAAAGVEVVHHTRWTVYFLDPEGNRVGLTHYPHDPEE